MDNDVTTMQAELRIGCAGWNVPAEHSALFPISGSHLERYAQRFSAVEINSSFYKRHRRETYEKWARSVPEHFRFSVKLPREITHQLRLAHVDHALAAFLEQVTGLNDRLGVLLVQLPPSLPFDSATVSAFLGILREQFSDSVACEPRHRSWFQPDADHMLAAHCVARVAADPASVSGADQAGGWRGLVYYRLHGSPQMYYSAYQSEWLQRLAEDLLRSSASVPTWCIFDNTALGAATVNAIAVQDMALRL